MGILNGNVICEALCAKSLICSVPTVGIPPEVDSKSPVNLYIDGPILLYSGNITTNYQMNPLIIIEKKLRKIISVVNSRYTVLSVFIFFDGSAPREKAPRQLQRANRNSTYNIQEVKANFCKRFERNCDSNPPIIINNLLNGEAEMEMYRMRDKSANSVIYTKDTDMFTIAYGHSGIDDVIFCQERIVCGSCPVEKVYAFFDMRKFCYPGISCEVFTCLMGFVGTDYTETRLSLTQIKCILHYCDTNSTSIFNVISNNEPNIEQLYLLVDNIKLFFQRQKNEGNKERITESRKYGIIRDPEYLQTILWYINYIKYGYSN